MTTSRWQHCVSYCDREAEEFIGEYFAQAGRKCLLIAGAGFDPRSAAVGKLLAPCADGNGSTLRALFIRERRPNPKSDLVAHGDGHTASLTKLIPDSRVLDVDVLSADGAVVGGQRVIAAMANAGLVLPLDVTDIVLDMSALSIGISFPLAAYLLELTGAAGPTNFHLMAASHAQLDAAITSIPNDVVDPAKGFSGQIDLEQSAGERKIWLPHLALERNSALQLILDKMTGPVDVCPVVPISQRDPKAADRLIAEFESELYEDWKVDPRDLVYAIEDDPLDLYRTISAIHGRNQRVLNSVANSHLVLSPSGNKVLAIGALMAALEHKIAVRYVESVDYEIDWEKINNCEPEKTRLVHVWLQGAPYAEIVVQEAEKKACDAEPAS